MQKLILIGNIGADATVSDLPSGKQVINFNLAVTEKINNESQTTWFKCAQFTNNVSLAPYLLKGSKVAVVGKPAIESYTANDGTVKSNLKCIVFEIELLGSNTNSNPQPQAPAIPEASKKQSFEPAANQEEHDDLPF